MFYAVLALSLLYFVLLKVWDRLKYDLHKIPSPPSTPFLGHWLSFLRGETCASFSFWVRDWHKKLGYPKLMWAQMGGQKVLAIMDMNILRKLVCPLNDSLPKGGTVPPKLDKIFAGADPTPYLVSSKHETPYVKLIRRGYLQSFTSQGLKQALPKQKEVIRDLMRHIENRRKEGALDMQELFLRTSIDHIGKVTMDLNLGGLDDSNPLMHLIVTCANHLDLLSPVPWYEIHMWFPFLQRTKRMKRDFAALHKLLDEMLQAVMSRGEPEPGDVALWATLRRMRLPNTNERLSPVCIRSELATAILAGTSTVGQQLSWIFALLAAHPRVVNKLVEELQDHGLYGEGAREVEFEDLAELKYLKAVVKEGMRRMHANPFISERTVHRDMTIDGYRVPKGTSVLIPGMLPLNNETQWEEHLEFKPERWFEDKDRSDTFHVPFGVGTRHCVGEKIALQFMRVAILYLSKGYSFELKGQEIETLLENAGTGLVYIAPNGVNVAFTPRN